MKNIYENIEVTSEIHAEIQRAYQSVTKKGDNDKLLAVKVLNSFKLKRNVQRLGTTTKAIYTDVVVKMQVAYDQFNG